MDIFRASLNVNLFDRLIMASGHSLVEERIDTNRLIVNANMTAHRVEWMARGQSTAVCGLTDKLN